MSTSRSISIEQDTRSFTSKETKQLETVDVDGAKSEVDTVAIVSDEDIAKIHRRIDWRIMPWLSFTYLVMRIDVGNISNAAIMNIEANHGIKQELHLSAQQWTWAVACFFYSYGALEPLSTLLMRKMSPSICLARLMITWGIISCCLAAVRNYGGLITTRVLLGAAEAGYYPGVIYYLAFWFSWQELPLRIAVFYAFGQVAGFVSGFLSYAISFADGHAGLSGWRWLFIIEGLPAIVCGVATYFILPDYPQTAEFLLPHERDAIVSRLAAHAPTKLAKTWDTRQVTALLKDPTFWSFAVVWFCHAVGGFGLSYVLPTVIHDLGFTDSAMSNVLTMPPSMAAFILLIILGWLVEKRYWNPFRVAMGLEFVNIICCILLITVKTTVVKYLALTVSTGTAGCVYPILWPARVNAARGTTAVGLAIGTTNAVAQFSGILGPQVFTPALGPSYRVSFVVCIALLGAGILAIAWSQFLIWRGTKRAEEDAGKLSTNQGAIP
ncbi:hypothetical protein PLICRDRAFT_580234 [Plicaturopsis crispa FD-325 SS-3]|nr:hypothetical protein PLICRDRAFT_580234 [Plicaturopsis crispa FD-325 SS-3]